MTVNDVRHHIQKALDAKKDLDASAASILHVEIEKFLETFKTHMGKNIDTARRTALVTDDVEEAIYNLREMYSV